ncbi:MAG TPA: ABC transporter permease [Povalibacter sp.]
MNMETWIPIVASTVAAATPLIIAALGILVSERAGVLNLGVEGIMLVGAVTAFAVGTASGSLFLGYVAAIGAGLAMGLLFGVLTLTLQANQVATGLALALFGVGLSAFLGKPFAGMPIDRIPVMPIPLLSDIPVLGPLLFRYDALVYLSIVLYFVVARFLYRSAPGLRLRAIGESPAVAHSLGYPVMHTRYMAVMFGSAMCALAGAYLSTALTPMWVEGMSAGRGWIVLALVVFATWRPLRVLLGAYLFGGVTVLQLHAQAFGVAIPSEFLSMLPYAATIVVLVVICRNSRTILLNQPASLGRSFHANG